jgi:ribonuclease BN (tRNA processing enzyme)
MKTTRAEKLMLVGPRGLDRVLDGLRMAFGSNLFETKFPVELRMLAPGERVEIGPDSTLSVAKTPHTPESLAIRIEGGGRSFCYTGDTAYSDDLASFFIGADLLVSECSFREPRERGAHLSVKEVARLAARAGVAKLIATHFYFEVDDAELKDELERHFGGEVIIGRDGLRAEV